jgi:hypothetical protein
MTLNQISRVSFAIHPFEGTFAVTPILNGAPLTEVVQAFESAQGFESAGAYGGLIPQWFKYGPLDRYFLGDVESDSYFGRLGHIYLLECTCGEAGCWPLAARVKADADTVVWNSFQQPHRPEWDYSQFGPFAFEGNEYRQGLTDLQGDLSARLSSFERGLS